MVLPMSTTTVTQYHNCLSSQEGSDTSTSVKNIKAQARVDVALEIYPLGQVDSVLKTLELLLL